MVRLFPVAAAASAAIIIILLISVGGVTAVAATEEDESYIGWLTNQIKKPWTTTTTITFDSKPPIAKEEETVDNDNPASTIAVPSSNTNKNNHDTISPPAGPLPDVDISDSVVCSDEEDGTCSSTTTTPSPTSSSKDDTVAAAAVPSGAMYCPGDYDINEEYHVWDTLYCFRDSPYTPSTSNNLINKQSRELRKKQQKSNNTNTTNNTTSVGKMPISDFVSPLLQPNEVTPIIWRTNSKLVTQWAFQIGLPTELISSLLEYCDELGITDLMREYTTTKPIEAKEVGHNGNFLNLTKKKSHDDDGGSDNRTYSWYVQRPERKWQSNMHWISPANELSHEDYLRILSRGNFDSVLKAIGEALHIPSLVVYHLTFIGVSYSDAGFAHHDTTTTKGGVYNVIIPLLLEDDEDDSGVGSTVGPELILWDDTNGDMRGGYKYRIGVGAMMGDDAIHGTAECDYRNLTNAKHGGWIDVDDDDDDDNVDRTSGVTTEEEEYDDDKNMQQQEQQKQQQPPTTKRRRRSGMRLAATVYIGEIYPDNVENVANRTLTQIFPVRNYKWLLSQEARHYQDERLPPTHVDYYERKNSMHNDTGRKAFRVDDELTDCEDRAEKGMCESDVEGTRKLCLFSCKVYIEEGVTRVEKTKVEKKKEEDEEDGDKPSSNEVNVCTQNRTGVETCRTYHNDKDAPGDFITPNLKPGEMFPIIFREDGKQATPYAFQIGVPPELTIELLKYSNDLGLTTAMRNLVGDNPLELVTNDDGRVTQEYWDEFFELNDGNDWYGKWFDILVSFCSFYPTHHVICY